MTASPFPPPPKVRESRFDDWMWRFYRYVHPPGGGTPPFTTSYYDVTEYGARGDYVADDTLAIQAAINAAEADGKGAVFFPTGTYKTTATLYVESNYVALIGASMGGARIIPTGNFGDAIHVRPPGAGFVQQVQIDNLTIYTASDTTSGAGLRLQECNYCSFTNLSISERLGGIHVDSCVHCYFDNIFMTSNSLWAAQKSGSYLLKINDASGGSNSELHFSNCDWRGNSVVNNYLQYAVLIEACDGAWFDNLHCGFVYDTAFAIKPNATGAAVVAICCNNIYCDTADNYGLHMVEFSSGQTASANAIINGYINYNCAEAIRVDHRAGSIGVTNMWAIAAGSRTMNYGINFVRAIDSCVTQARLTDVTTNAVYIQGNANGIGLSNIHVRKEALSGTAAGIYIVDGATNINVNGATFENCTVDIDDRATASSKWFGDIKSDAAVPTASANGSGVLTLPAAYELFNLGTANAVTSIVNTSSWKNRQVTLIASGTVTVSDGNNLALTDNNHFYAKAAQTITLRCDGTNWYEVARMPPAEENTYTPVLAFGGASTGITYSIQKGSYEKSGNWVSGNGFIELTSKGSATGDATISIPFSVRNDNDSYACASFYMAGVTFANQHQHRIVPGSTTISLNEVTEAGTPTTLTDANFANNSVVIFSFRYRTA